MAAENAKYNTRIQLKHDTEANWLKAINFIPKAGEMIIYDADDTNPVRIKIGDGTTKVNELPFYNNNSVLFIEQILSDSQKAQARENIGALSALDELITVEDIDTICGTTIQLASEVEF